jgi:hypothetical protein
MKQKDKVLLIKDLCGRLPYRVKASTKIGTNIIVSFIGDDTIIGEDGDSYDISFITPYLYPLSSMTEEQCYKLASIRSGFQDCWKYIKTPIPLEICNFEQIDWFHRNHFDYRGLIPMKLAIDATGKNIY